MHSKMRRARAAASERASCRDVKDQPLATNACVRPFPSLPSYRPLAQYCGIFTESPVFARTIAPSFKKRQAECSRSVRQHRCRAPGMGRVQRVTLSQALPLCRLERVRARCSMDCENFAGGAAKMASAACDRRDSRQAQETRAREPGVFHRRLAEEHDPRYAVSLGALVRSHLVRGTSGKSRSPRATLATGSVRRGCSGGGGRGWGRRRRRTN